MAARKRHRTSHVNLVVAMKDAGHLHRVLVSHDAGWYTVGEANGGTYRGYETVFTDFKDALLQAGLTEADFEQITVANSRAAFAIGAKTVGIPTSSMLGLLVAGAIISGGGALLARKQR